MEPLHCGFVARQPGHDDVALTGQVLHPDHQQVAVEDAVTGHGVAPHPQRERVLVPHQFGWQRQGLLDVLLGQHPRAGRHVPP